MTKKHFEELADLIRDMPTTISKEQLLKELAPFLKRQNPRFDNSRFCARATEQPKTAEAQELKNKIIEEAQARGINGGFLNSHLIVIR